MKLRGWIAPAALATLVALAGCSRADPRAFVPAPADEGGDVAVAAGPTQLEITADPGGGLAFSATEMTAAAGQPISVAFSNPGNQPHNWALVEPDQAEAVAAAALPNQGNVPEGTPGAIAAGAILQPGESEEIPVEPLEPGEYLYICTFPGHYPSMQGTFTVGEATADAGGAATATAGEGGEAAGGGGAAVEAGGTIDIDTDPAALAYAQTAFTAPADQAFTVNFANVGNQPHNFAIVEEGQEDAVAQAALPELGNIPDGTPGVLAAGAIIQPGESEEIPVDGLPAGTYTYICTFPGHTASMRGTVTVQ